jgi:hypothetical protein
MRKLICNLFFLFFVTVSQGQIDLPRPKNLSQIKVVIPYLQNKISLEYYLKSVIITVHNANDIRVIIKDANFIENCSSTNCDSVCLIMAKKIKQYSKEKSDNFIDSYKDIVIILAKNGDHIIKGSTIDTKYIYSINKL